MSGLHGDVRRLIKFSLANPMYLAFYEFPMFSPQQIAALYRLGAAERKRLLTHESADDSLSHMIDPLRDHRSAAQAEKMREQAIDPSNR